LEEVVKPGCSPWPGKEEARESSEERKEGGRASPPPRERREVRERRSMARRCGGVNTGEEAWRGGVAEATWEGEFAEPSSRRR
jgi:hypothetical protein